MHDFRKALADNPAPARLGDITLRFAPSMLIGETGVARATTRPTLLVGIALALLAVSAVLLGVASELVALPFLLASAGAFAGSALLLRRERRRRGFVVNFATSTLRLDLSTPFAGRPRTLLVPFRDVKAVQAVEQGPALRCLTVDFALEGELFREVLVAGVPPSQDDAANRLLRVLQNAFGFSAGEAAAPPVTPLSR
ncbi:MAG: hypothetical protein JNJ54_26985 [Myxococcaceae bacterium]|nr:hypothetical protein [Myxococcaceae bacterium]